jgi:hypothetical protein
MRATPRNVPSLSLCAALTACSPDHEDETPLELENLEIQFSPMYSAYDGVHDYRLAPSIPSLDANSHGMDPVDPSSVRWIVDESFVKPEHLDALPAGLLLTTKQAGTTMVSATALAQSGKHMRGNATLTISRADPKQWERGSERYEHYGPIFIDTIGPRAPESEGVCGLSPELSERLPKEPSCIACHNPDSELSQAPTPTQTGGYRDDQLIDLFTRGVKPAGSTYNSPFLRMAEMPDCLYEAFHTWDIDDETKHGILWKLRSLAPEKHDYDFAPEMQ